MKHFLKHQEIPFRLIFTRNYLYRNIGNQS